MFSRSPESTGSDSACRPEPAPGVRLPHIPALDSAALLAGGSEVAIRHGAETYRLRLTRQNRLILTK